MQRLFGHTEILIDSGASASKDQLECSFPKQEKNSCFRTSLSSLGLAYTVSQGNTHCTSVYWNYQNSRHINQVKQ